MCGYNSRSKRSLRHNDEEVTEKTQGDWAADPDVCRKLALGPELSDRVLGLTWKVALGGGATQGYRIVTGSLLPQPRGSHFLLKAASLGHTSFPVTFVSSASPFSVPVTCLQTV